jgi:hypothetical protein
MVQGTVTTQLRINVNKLIKLLERNAPSSNFNEYLRTDGADEAVHEKSDEDAVGLHNQDAKLLIVKVLTSENIGHCLCVSATYYTLE